MPKNGAKLTGYKKQALPDYLEKMEVQKY